MSDVRQFRRPLPRIEDATTAQQFNQQLQQYVIDRKHLAEWLRNQADLIDADRLEVEPRAAMLVLSGINASETLHLGFGRKDGPTMTNAFRAARALFNNPQGERTFVHPADEY